MNPDLLAPDQALADRPADYSDPELAEYTEEVAEDIMATVVAYMPIVLPVMGAVQVFMFAVVAVWLA